MVSMHGFLGVVMFFLEISQVSAKRAVGAGSATQNTPPVRVMALDKGLWLSIPRGALNLRWASKRRP